MPSTIDNTSSTIYKYLCVCVFVVCQRNLVLEWELETGSEFAGFIAMYLKNAGGLMANSIEGARSWAAHFYKSNTLFIVGKM